jgi:alpha-mannosidase
MYSKLSFFLAISGLVAFGATKPPVEEVIVVFKTHFDIGYTSLAGDVVNRYRTTMIDKALDLVDASKSLPPENQFVWTVPGWPLQQILWDGQTPERRARILAAIRDGRVVFHALPFTTHSESLELEDLVRGLGWSSSLARQLGQPLPREAKMTDVPEHTWILPTILHHSGVEFLHIGCNAASSSPAVPELFWWEGPDGSRVLTMYSAKDYGTGLAPPPGWPHKTWLAMIMTGDNQGPPDVDSVNKLLEEAKRDLPGVRVRFGRMSDFADAIAKEHGPIPVVRGDMPDTWIHGVMSLPVETKAARDSRPQLSAAAALDTLLRAWGTDPTPVRLAEAGARELSLLYGEHTWGYNSVYFGFLYGEAWRDSRASGHYARQEQSWNDHSEYARATSSITAALMRPSLTALAQGVSVAGRRVVVFNPLPWRRNAVVNTALPDLPSGALKDVSSGAIVPAVRDGVMVQFVARSLPPMGYRTYVPADVQQGAQAISANGNVLENEFLRVELDPARAGVRSIKDKRSGRELVDASSPYAFGEYLYQRFDSNDVAAFVKAYAKIDADWAKRDFGKLSLPPASERPHADAVARKSRLEFEQSGSFARAILRTPAGDGLPDATTLRVTLYAGLPFLDVEWGIPGKTADPWPEAGWLAMPVKAASPSFRLGRTGSIIDPAKETVEGSGHDQYCLNTGLVVTGEDGSGTALVPLDSPVVSLGVPGGWRYSPRFESHGSTVFVNLFNNQWSTNFAQWNGGTWTSRVRVWATASASADRSLIVGAWDARQPPMVAVGDGAAGKLPLSAQGLELSMAGVLATAFGENPDGPGLLLRLWEQAGGSGNCRVKLPPGLHAAVALPVDLRGRPIGDPVTIREGAFEVRMKPYAPASFLLQ